MTVAAARLNRRVLWNVLLVTALMLAQTSAFSGVASVDDPEVETRLKSLAKDLRCLVCQNQSLADSDAGLAQDLRNEVRLLIQQGQSNRQISEYLVARYGDFVLYNPPLRGTTVLLWLGPAILLLAGVWILCRQLRRHRLNDLEADEQARVHDENQQTQSE